jgi:hypothetical protein
MTLNKRTHSIMTTSNATLSKTTLDEIYRDIMLNMKLSIVMLTVIMLDVIMLSVMAPGGTVKVLKMSLVFREVGCRPVKHGDVDFLNESGAKDIKLFSSVRLG